MFENMSATEKIKAKLNALEACIAKCEDISYSVHATLGDNKEELLAKMRIEIQNGRILFSPGRLENLDYDVRQETIRTWNAKLNRYLSMFPEYKVDEERTMSK